MGGAITERGLQGGGARMGGGATWQAELLAYGSGEGEGREAGRWAFRWEGGGGAPARGGADGNMF